MDIAGYQRQLLALERELVERLGEDIATARDAPDDQAEVADEAQVEDLKEDFFGLAQTDSEVLAQVRAALRRIDDGTYGQCVVDGEPIGEARLQALPWTPYCVRHQQMLEEKAGIRTPSL